MNSGKHKKHPSLKDPAILLATWFGCGLARKAPGTWGSLGALPPGLLLGHYGGAGALGMAAILITAIGFWAAERYDKAAGAHDSKQIVIDEVAGQWLSLLPLFVLGNLSWVLVVAAFALFRFFDILKPWPVSFFDKKVKGAAGVMLDDIAAGCYAALCLTGVLYAGFG
ncbi:MAG: phosphatidylglycerophosphatase A [Alphaproteobacteria bacterium]|nr:phosphatidylglycerophosphatase A [Alphaproteobacteria bacterium]